MKTFLKFLSFLFAVVLFSALAGVIHLFIEKTWFNVVLTMAAGSVFFKGMNAFLDKVNTVLDDKK